MKKLLIVFLLISGVAVQSKAQLEEWPKMKNLKLKETRIASGNILIAFFLGPDLNEITTNLPEWKLNGSQPVSLDKWITPV